MDQAESEDQNFPREQPQRSHDADMDRPDHHAGAHLYEVSGEYGSIHYTDPAVTAVKPVQEAKFMGAV